MSVWNVVHSWLCKGGDRIKKYLYSFGADNKLSQTMAATAAAAANDSTTTITTGSTNHCCPSVGDTLSYWAKEWAIRLLTISQWKEFLPELISLSKKKRRRQQQKQIHHQFRPGWRAPPTSVCRWWWSSVCINFDSLRHTYECKHVHIPLYVNNPKTNLDVVYSHGMKECHFRSLDVWINRLPDPKNNSFCSEPSAEKHGRESYQRPI